jgi:hypothetical protein
MRKLLFVSVVVLLAAAKPPQAWASEITGDALAYTCQGNAPGAKTDQKTQKYAEFCNAYINGWDDARFAFLQGTTTYCPPRITVKELSVVFIDYWATHREVGKLPAAEALMTAFKEAWPCHH